MIALLLAASTALLIVSVLLLFTAIPRPRRRRGARPFTERATR